MTVYILYLMEMGPEKGRVRNVAEGVMEGG